MNTHPEIAKRAYELWEQAGRPHGQDKQHWLQAEAEFKARSAPVPTAKADRAQTFAKTPKTRRSSPGIGEPATKRVGALS